MCSSASLQAHLSSEIMVIFFFKSVSNLTYSQALNHPALNKLLLKFRKKLLPTYNRIFANKSSRVQRTLHSLQIPPTTCCVFHRIKTFKLRTIRKNRTFLGQKNSSQFSEFRSLCQLRVLEVNLISLEIFRIFACTNYYNPTEPYTTLTIQLSIDKLEHINRVPDEGSEKGGNNI